MLPQLNTGSGLEGVMVNGPMKTIVGAPSRKALQAALASRIVWRSDPAPESAAVLTVRTKACACGAMAMARAAASGDRTALRGAEKPGRVVRILISPLSFFFRQVNHATGHGPTGPSTLRPEMIPGLKGARLHNFLQIRGFAP